MILALAVAIAIGFLVFTVLRPSPAAPVQGRAPAPISSGASPRS
jgi:hypothetical protein